VNFVVKKGSNSFAMVSRSMPQPVSATSMQVWGRNEGVAGLPSSGYDYGRGFSLRQAHYTRFCSPRIQNSSIFFASSRYSPESDYFGGVDRWGNASKRRVATRQPLRQNSSGRAMVLTQESFRA
jgi:hypothetical protein